MRWVTEQRGSVPFGDADPDISESRLRRWTAQSGINGGISDGLTPAGLTTGSSNCAVGPLGPSMKVRSLDPPLPASV